MKSILYSIVMVPVIIMGAFAVSVLFMAHIEYLPTFFLPENSGFWDDVIAYRLKAEDQKSLGQLYQAYDKALVHNCAVDYSIHSALIPNQQAALSYWLQCFLDSEQSPPQVDIPWYFFTRV